MVVAILAAHLGDRATTDRLLDARWDNTQRRREMLSQSVWMYRRGGVPSSDRNAATNALGEA